MTDNTPVPRPKPAAPVVAPEFNSTKSDIFEKAQELKEEIKDELKGIETKAELLPERLGLDGSELSAWQQQTSPDKYLLKAKRVVMDHLNKQADYSNKIGFKEVYIVWFAKTLQNWKALVSTVHYDGLYFEVTYNGHAGETYLNIFQKVGTTTVPD